MKTKSKILPLATAATFAFVAASVSTALGESEMIELTQAEMEVSGDTTEDPSKETAELPASASASVSKPSASVKKSPTRTRSQTQPKTRSSSEAGASAKRNGKEDAQRAYFGRLDGDGNGRITYEEFAERRPGRKVSSEALRSTFVRLDSNRNGYCTPAEFVRARLAKAPKAASSLSTKAPTPRN